MQLQEVTHQASVIHPLIPPPPCQDVTPAPDPHPPVWPPDFNSGTSS